MENINNTKSADKASSPVIKVRLVHRNYKQPHQIFMKLIKDPPEGILYSYPKEKTYLKKYLWIYRRFGETFLVKKLVLLAQKTLLRPQYNNEADLLHVVDRLIEIKPETPPFVIDIGHISSLFGFREPSSAEAESAKQYLEDIKCKRIIARSQASLKTIQDFYGEEFNNIKDKCVVVYPAVEDNLRIYGEHGARTDHKIKLLFVGTPVWQKGLSELLKALSELEDEYPEKADKLELTIVTAEIEEVKNFKYLPRRNIVIKEQVDNETLIKNYFLQSDIFVNPSHSEVFGMVFLEAFSCRLPALGVRQYSTPEIISANDGFLIDSDNCPLDKALFAPRREFEAVNFVEPEEKVVKQIKSILSKIVDGKYDLSAMGRNAHHHVEGTEKFSIKERQRALKDIYEASLK